MAKQTQHRPVDRKIKAIERATARHARLAGEATARGQSPGDLPEVARAWTSVCRAINGLVPLVADADYGTSRQALLALDQLGPHGIAGLLATMFTTRDARLRIAIIRGLGAIGGDCSLTVITALHRVVAEHDDEAHRQALREAITSWMHIRAAHRRAALAAAAGAAPPG